MTKSRGRVTGRRVVVYAITIVLNHNYVDAAANVHVAGDSYHAKLSSQFKEERNLTGLYEHKSVAGGAAYRLDYPNKKNA